MVGSRGCGSHYELEGQSGVALEKIEEDHCASGRTRSITRTRAEAKKRASRQPNESRGEASGGRAGPSRMTTNVCRRDGG